jgi:hypothetical protein
MMGQVIGSTDVDSIGGAVTGMCVNCAWWNGGEIVGECRQASENHAKFEETGDVGEMGMFAAPLLTQRWFGCNQFRNQGERK